MALDISPRFRLLARGAVPATDDLLQATRLGTSSYYVEAVQDGADIELEHEAGLDVRIWSPEWVVEMNEIHDVRARVDGVAVGDADGLFLIERENGLFAVGPGALDPDELRFVAPNLGALLGGSLGKLA